MPVSLTTGTARGMPVSPTVLSACAARGMPVSPTALLLKGMPILLPTFGDQVACRSSVVGSSGRSAADGDGSSVVSVIDAGRSGNGCRIVSAIDGVGEDAAAAVAVGGSFNLLDVAPLPLVPILCVGNLPLVCSFIRIGSTSCRVAVDRSSCRLTGSGHACGTGDLDRDRFTLGVCSRPNSISVCNGEV